MPTLTFVTGFEVALSRKQSLRFQTRKSDDPECQKMEIFWEKLT